MKVTNVEKSLGLSLKIPICYRNRVVVIGEELASVNASENVTLNRRIEDGRERPEDEGVRRVTLHDATLTVSNDESPYFHSSPLPHPVAVPEACRLARIPAMGSQAKSFQLDRPSAAPRPPAFNGAS
ncbi:hypothetical protein T03_17594 [Trichinella britovi]|uniref:Uncharacterized protein n=1 Tax=Trichinella britovi TaxID=45882 RepID=A0A0V1C5H5_TRIBR|nr:hypothetical protein T03_17594 [Trichinella britovi]